MPVRYRLLEQYRVYLVVELGRDVDTWREYRRTLLAFWAHGGREPADVNLRDLERFTHRGLAEQTVHNYTSHVKGFYRWMVEAGHLARDPFARVRVPTVHQGPPRALPLEAVARVINYAYSQPRLWVMLWTAYGAGLRCAEVASLRIEDCDLDPRAPSLRVVGKGRKPRQVALHPVVCDVLTWWLQDRPGSGPVFEPETRPGEHLCPDYVSELLCGALKAAKVRATAHQLRHTFASLILAECEDLRAVQQLLGHASIKSTERYTSGVTARTRQAAEALPIPGRTAAR
ncbi:MAG TPA: tyrosine-type recombinase/integrase [Streptosporangiaceae bacterium]